MQAHTDARYVEGTAREIEALAECVDLIDESAQGNPTEAFESLLSNLRRRREELFPKPLLLEKLAHPILGPRVLRKTVNFRHKRDDLGSEALEMGGSEDDCARRIPTLVRYSKA